MTSDDDKSDSLAERIRRAEAKPKKEEPPASGGRNIGFDFVGSVAICGIVGALADRAFNTSPWCLLGMVLMGFVVGVWTAWLSMQKNDKN
jgi:F0F1-type ATP synthase assembly protein I